MITFNPIFPLIPKAVLPGLVLCLMVGLPTNTSHAGDPFQSPLFLTVTMSPNLVVTLDTSTSMFAAHTPDSPNGGTGTRRYKSAYFNPMYYNPTVKYTAPTKFDGTAASTSFAAAYINGFATTLGSTVNLSTNYRPTSNYNPDVTTQTFANHYSSTVAATDFRCTSNICQYKNNATWSNFPSSASCSGTSTVNCADDNMAAYYYVFNAANTGCDGTKTNDACYTLKIVNATSGPATADINGDGTINSADQDERQNFANWYSFYRVRTLALISAADRAFLDVPSDTRLAWQNLNVCRDFTGSNCLGRDGITNYPNYIKAFTGPHRENFFKWLFNIDSASGTPLRNAVQRVGEYYKKASTTTDANSPYAEFPQSSMGTEYSCRKNFHLLMTDGEWNSSGIPGDTGRTILGNLDGGAATLPDNKTYPPTQKPYTDTNSDSLADVIFKYWSTDLRSGLTNNVPPYFVDPSGSLAPINRMLPSTWSDAQYFNAKNDPATWQHMVTFTVGLGLTEQLTDPIWGGSTYAGDYANLVSGSKSWPSTGTTVGKVYDLWHGALDGRGQFFSVEDPDAMVNAFKVVLRIAANSASASASGAAANSTQLNTGTQVFQARFNSGDWSGEIRSFNVAPATGVLTPNWTSSLPGSRNIFTYNPTVAAGSRGVLFQWNSLTCPGPSSGTCLAANIHSTGTSQHDYLNRLLPATSGDGNGALRVNWLRGDQTNEKISDADTITYPTHIFKKRTNVLGDIINSDPIFVGAEDFGYGTGTSLSSTEQTTYTAFRATSGYTGRLPMIYVGANDGMLHGFNASQAGGGQEVFAYIPNALFPELSKLTAPGYSHQYYVDGSSAVSDVYDPSITGSWRTLLAGTTGAGGKAVFALDITNPPGTAAAFTAFASASALWEFTNVAPPVTTNCSAFDIATPSFTSANYDTNDLGFTLAQPAVVRLQNGKWVVIVANGYESVNGHAVLFVLDAKTGCMIRKIDTGAGPSTPVPPGRSDKNGLSTPVAVDTDNDRSVDTVYAGDLYGNLWEFDLSSIAAPSSWAVANSGAPLFVACTTTGAGASCPTANRQPITGKPNVGSVGGAGTDQNNVGRMVYFGTGKYFEENDGKVGSSPQVQTFYGLWDQGSAITDRANLQEQAIEFDGFPPTTCPSGTGTCPSARRVRVVSKNPVCYSNTSPLSPGCTATSPLKKGWALNLQPPAPGTAQGERMISFPLVRRGLVIFSTAIPDPDPCSPGGRSFLMEVDALSGGESSSPAFDVNGSRTVSNDDFVTVNGISRAASGQDLGIGMTDTPVVVESPSTSSTPGVDFKYLSGTSGSMDDAVNKGPDGGGGGGGGSSGSGTRKSWRQLR